MTENSARPDDRDPIPSFQFSTESVEVKDQFDLWHEFIAPLADVKQPEGSGKGFRGNAKVHDFGVMQLCSFDTDRIIFNRSQSQISKYGIEHWGLSFIDGGKLEVRPGAHHYAATGEMRLQSFAMPFSGQVEGAGVSCMYLSRDGFADIADVLDGMLDRNLSGHMAALLRDFMVSIGKRAEALSASEIRAINAAFSHLLKATVRPTADTLEAAKLPIAATQFDAAKRIINANLKAPDLSTDMICARMGISRRQLYYIFEQHGGVMKFITQRRLAACYNELGASTDKKLISSVAYEYGFTNLSSFYRQFQARYGFRPSEARSAWLNGHSRRETKSANFANWLLRTDEA